MAFLRFVHRTIGRAGIIRVIGPLTDRSATTGIRIAHLSRLAVIVGSASVLHNRTFSCDCIAGLS